MIRRFNRSFYCNVILSLLIVFENLLLYVFNLKKCLSPGNNAVGLFVTSLLFGVVLIYKFYDREIAAISNFAAPRKLNYLPIAVFIAGILLLVWQTYVVVLSYPIDPFYSDIIPVVKHQCMQFLKGLSPYAPVNYFGYNEYPNNLPFKWLPFLLAERFGFDYRLEMLGIWVVAISIVFARTTGLGQAKQVLIALFIIGGTSIVINCNAAVFAETIELLIAAYYVFFMVSINQKSVVVQAIAIGVCLLSRFTLILWLPLYIFILFVDKQHKKLFKVALAGALFVGLFLLPFVWNNNHLLKESYTNYDIVAQYEWTHHLNPNGISEHLLSGAGFAFFISTSNASMPIPQKIALLEKIQLRSILTFLAVSGTWYWFNRKKTDRNIFAMASFKIYLTLFLFFVKVPYLYLMCVGNFVSIAVFAEQFRYKTLKKEQL
jgi:hypothetical protein